MMCLRAALALLAALVLGGGLDRDARRGTQLEFGRDSVNYGLGLLRGAR